MNLEYRIRRSLMFYLIVGVGRISELDTVEKCTKHFIFMNDELVICVRLVASLVRTCVFPVLY